MAKIYTRLTLEQQAQAFDLLKQHYDKEAGAYREEWSDARIAAEIGAPPSSVAYRRLGVFGPFKTPEPEASPDPRVEALERRVCILDKRLAALEAALGEPQLPLGEAAE